MADSRMISTYNQTLPCSEDELRDLYDDWATTYDEEYKEFGWGGPLITANTVAAFVHDKQAKILDLASGTGMVCEQLRNFGYSNIDALDMSQGSLKICKQKQIYKQLMCACIGSTPLDIPDGGIIVNTMRHEYLWTVEEFKDNKLENAIQNMVDTHSWEMLSRQTHERYFHDKTGIAFVVKVL